MRNRNIEANKGGFFMTHISNLIELTLTPEQVKQLNKYHNAPEKEGKYAEIREACEHLMNTIYAVCPTCCDTTKAINLVRETRMWANSAIALNGLELFPKNEVGDEAK